MVNHPLSGDATIRHNQPDYHAEVDQASSSVAHTLDTDSSLTLNRLFTPVPKRIMNGSEEGEVLPAAVLSGAPVELQARTVRYNFKNSQEVG